MERWHRFWEDLGKCPARSLALFTGISSLLWVVQTSLCQKILPLDAVEAVVWGEEMQWGQAKSPPLSGWIAYFFSFCSGYSDWGVYLAAQLTIVCGIFFTYKLAREFFEETEAATAALLLFFLFYYMPPAMKFCSHDTQIALFPCIGFFFLRALKGNRWLDWCCLSVAAAAATLGKYSTLQLLAGCFVYLLFSREYRKRLLSFGPWLSGILYLLLLAPHVQWLFRNDFISFSHMGSRLTGSSSPWYVPLEAIGTMLMPYAIFAALLLAVRFPWREWGGRCALRREPAVYSLMLTVIPGAFYLLPALFGYSIILMWFSYLASFSGITAVALLPWRISREMFRNLLVLVWILFFCLFIGVTIDVLAKPRYRIHTSPEMVVEMASAYYHRHASGRIPVVYGDRWLAGVLQLYSPDHPRCCVAGDPCNLALYRETIRRNGALLIGARKTNYRYLLAPLGMKPGKMECFRYRYSAQFGRSKESEIWFGYLPPVSVK